MKTSEKNKLVRQWIREHGAVKFDFKEQDIILQDGLLFSIDKEIKKLHKIKRAKPTFDGKFAVELTKQKFKTECYQCRIWFQELDSMIEYLKDMKKLLNTLGYSTEHKGMKRDDDNSD
jgi:hypothetical protein